MSKHRYRKISTRIWGDANFRSFSNNGKLVWFFVLTHPQMTSMGAMRATIPGLAAELGWSEKAFREAFREPLSKGMLKVDEKASLLVVPKFLFHNAPESPNVVTSWSSQYEVLPECQLLTVYLQEVKGFVEGLGEGFRKAFAIPLSKGMPYPELQPELDPELQPEPESPPIPLRGGETAQSNKFAEFWKAYPKKISKGDAEKAWKAGKCDRHIDAILQSLEKHKVWQDWTKEGGKFIPHPAKWLRRLGWENDLEIHGLEIPGMATGSDDEWA